jgi:hypothetical protein
MTPRRRSAFRRNRTVVEGEVLRYGFGTTSVAAVGVVLSSKGVVAIAIRESPDDSAMLDDFETRFPGHTFSTTRRPYGGRSTQLLSTLRGRPATSRSRSTSVGQTSSEGYGAQ